MTGDATRGELRARLSGLWATLDAYGAHTDRLSRSRLDRLTGRQLAALCAEARERARVLSSPEAAANIASTLTHKGAA